VPEQLNSPEAQEADDPIRDAIETYLRVQDPSGENIEPLSEAQPLFSDEDLAQFEGSDIPDLSLPENQRALYSPTGILHRTLDQLGIIPEAELAGKQLESLQVFMSNKYEEAAQSYAAKHLNAQVAPNPYADPDTLKTMVRQAQRRRQTFARRRSGRGS
jgi:hypothetical protein